MPSSPLSSTHSRTTSGVAFHHSILIETMSNDVGRGLTSPPLDCTHSWTTSGVALHHRLWTTHTVKRRRVWHTSISFGQHMVERRRAWHHITSFGQRTRSNDVECDMPSPPLESTHGRTTSGVACHHRLWAIHTIERRLAGHAIIAHGRQTRSNDVRRDMLSPPLGSTQDRMTSGVACHNIA